MLRTCHLFQKISQNWCQNWPYIQYLGPSIRYLLLYKTPFCSVPSKNWPNSRFDLITDDHITDTQCIAFPNAPEFFAYYFFDSWLMKIAQIANRLKSMFELYTLFIVRSHRPFRPRSVVHKREWNLRVAFDVQSEWRLLPGCQSRYDEGTRT